jgi:hypothetical protein
LVGETDGVAACSCLCILCSSCTYVNVWWCCLCEYASYHCAYLGCV